jgi:hypothetical protein
LQARLSVRLAILIPVGAVVVATGCDPTYAPPIRAVQYGAPARLTEGRVEIGATAAGLAVPNDFSPHLAVGVRDWLALEAGGNALLGAGRNGWALGFVGSRFSMAPNRERRTHFIGDLELGAGAGVGGVLTGNATLSPGCRCDGLSGFDRVAGGGYAGFGIGAQIAWFSIYTRTRFEVSAATNVPVTVWPSTSIGLEANLRKRAAITLGGGYLGYANAVDHIHAWFWQIGVTFMFDAFAPLRRGPSAVRPPTPPRPTPPPAPAYEDEEEFDEPWPDDADDTDDTE